MEGAVLAIAEFLGLVGYEALHDILIKTSNTQIV